MDFHHYIMAFPDSDDFFWTLIFLVQYNHMFYLISIYMIYLLMWFNFQLTKLLDLKWVSCIQYVVELYFLISLLIFWLGYLYHLYLVSVLIFHFCYNLNLKYSPQAYVLINWFSVCCRPFRRCGLPVKVDQQRTYSWFWIHALLLGLLCCEVFATHFVIHENNNSFPTWWTETFKTVIQSESYIISQPFV